MPQLRKGPRAPVPFRAQPPGHRHLSAGPADPASTNRGSAPCSSLGRQAPAAARLRPPATPSDQLVRSQPLDPDPPAATGGQPAAQAGAQARTHPAAPSCELVSALVGTRPSGGTVLKSTLRPPRTWGRTAKAELLWRQLLRRFPSASGHRRCGLMRSVAEEPSRRALLAATLPGPSRRLAAAVEAARPTPARGASSLGPLGRGWPGAAARSRGAVSMACPTSRHGPQARLAGALAELGDGAGALACPR